MTAGDRTYGTQLGDVLRQRSTGALRAFLEAQAARFGDERQVEAIRAQSDAELEVLLHRMTLARADLADLHAGSQRWLAGQGDQGGPGGSPASGPPNRGPRPGGRPRRPRRPRS